MLARPARGLSGSRPDQEPFPQPLARSMLQGLLSLRRGGADQARTPCAPFRSVSPAHPGSSLGFGVAAGGSTSARGGLTLAHASPFVRNIVPYRTYERRIRATLIARPRLPVPSVGWVSAREAGSAASLPVPRFFALTYQS